MKRGIITSLAVAFAWWGVGTDFARAQFGGLGQPPLRSHPAVSPYINMGAGAGSALNYYGIVRPQTDANRSIYDLQSTVNRLNPDGSLQGQLDQQKAAAQTGLQTGHSAGFFNYGHYYPSAPPGGSNTALGGGASFGTGMGGYTPGVGGAFGAGNLGVQTFFGNTFNRPLVR